jgi:diadenylate cyclase
MKSIILSFLRNFRIHDFFDILIITSFIYFLLIWFKTSAYRLVFIGISILGGVYIIARLFHLYLTTVALQGFITILFIALVVIFQEDIRRLLERIASVRSFGRHPHEEDTAYSKMIEAVIGSVADFTSNHIGALIVIQGLDPLERHLKGGYPLGGEVTKPLLESLFDVHSLGHDGAVIINKDSVTRFGCHLPLSLKAEKFGVAGLRHTAALGLSERSDALCIVVSEEKGAITVILDSKLRPAQNPGELRTIMEKYIKDKLSTQTRKLSAFWFRQNTMEKFLALILSLGLWFVFGYQKESLQQDYVVPIVYQNISQMWEIEESKVREATITLTGSSQDFSLLDPKTLKISIDRSSLVEGMQTIKLSDNMVNMPSNMMLIKIDPEKITVVAHQLVSRNVPVHIDTVGQLPRGLVLKSLTATPDSVVALAPSSLREAKIFVSTEPIDLSGFTASRTMNVNILYSDNIRFKDNLVPMVKVNLQVEEVKAQRR